MKNPRSFKRRVCRYKLVATMKERRAATKRRKTEQQLNQTPLCNHRSLLYSRANGLHVLLGNQRFVAAALHGRSTPVARRFQRRQGRGARESSPAPSSVSPNESPAFFNLS